MCDAVCLDCGSQPNECLACVAGRENPPLCSCLPGYYSNGVDPECFICDESCIACAGTSITCTTCKGSMDKRYTAPNC